MILMGALSCVLMAAPAEKPNIVVILVDDLGYGDVSYQKAADLRTPRIDQLASQGQKWTRFYANCPVCSPTRAALLSGRYQEAVGVPGVIRTHAKNSWGYLDPSAVLLPKILNKAGYDTACIGKWHLGLESPNKPNEHGFDYFYGFLGDMMDDYYHHRRHGVHYMRENDKPIDPQGHATDIFTDQSIKYLKSHADGKPFFLYLAYNAPHGPIQPPKEWLTKYQKEHPKVSLKRAKLASFIEHTDHCIGKVLDTLDDLDLTKRTLVIFTSDNGGAMHYAANNSPWRAGKGTMYEGGLRVPTAMRWPGRIEAGTTTEALGLSMDLYPTIAHVAGAELPENIDGVDLLPVMLGKKNQTPERAVFFHRRMPGGTLEAAQKNDWKLLKTGVQGRWELYNLKDDPQEKQNLATQKPVQFRQMQALMTHHRQRFEKVPYQPPKNKTPAEATSAGQR